MPEKGWTNVSLKKEIFEKYEEMAKQRGQTVGEMLSTLLPYIRATAIIKSLREETIKEALIQEYYALEAFLTYCDAYTKSNEAAAKVRSLLPLEIWTFSEVVSLCCNKPLNWEALSISAKNECRKIERVLGSVRSWEYERIIKPIRSPTVITKVSINEDPEGAKKAFLSQLEESFGKDCVLLDQVIKKVEGIKEAVPEAESMIDLLVAIQKEVRQLMEAMSH
jgi:hypothetical protein